MPASPTITPNASNESPLPGGPQGFRWTRQRREVYQMLIETRDHPTASELFIRAQTHMPAISLATVYNCLETLAQAGLIRQVNIERGPSRFCPNLREHAHFYDESTGEVLDVELREGIDLHSIFKLPRGARVNRADISLKGTLAAARRK
ncbi:MAG: Fur family transcriptional regulator [Verrucomicrobiales bacterium]